MTLVDALPDHRPLRPVQFLGSKLRVLNEITEALSAGGATGTVWDAFTGSSVVAQSLAQRGHRVVASDALQSSVVFASALLGVGRSHPDVDQEEERLRGVIEQAERLPLRNGWEPWLESEAAALEDHDGFTLLRVGRELPQRWRNNWPPKVASATGQPPPLLSDTFAGTYFGLDQALRLERLREAVEVSETALGLSEWGRAVALTALCAAASRAVFSAGKHFAQPHHVPVNKALAFHAQRILQDRAVDVERVFAETVRDICSAARPGAEMHAACVRRVENVTTEDLVQNGVTSVYADPPYTAQQYSRFYHLLETLVSGLHPDLELVRGRVTKGLYPIGRYLSPFCSRRNAPGAFARLAGTAADAGARLVLSYSANTNPSGATGNARTLALSDLLAIVRDAYSPRYVSVEELDVRYRQFNQQSFETVGRRDSEYLIIGESRAR